MIKRAWFLISGLWSLFWIGGTLLTTYGHPKPADLTAVVLLGSIPWLLGLAIRWIASGSDY